MFKVLSVLPQRRKTPPCSRYIRRIPKNIFVLDTCFSSRKSVQVITSESVTNFPGYCESGSFAELYKSQIKGVPGLIVTELFSGKESVLSSLIIIRRIVRKFPLTAVIVNTAISDSRILGQLPSLNGGHVLCKTQPVSEFRDLLNATLKGGYFFSCTGRPGTLPYTRDVYLSSRELEILDYFLREFSMTEIAKITGLNVKTISCHKQQAMKKLNFVTHAKLIKWWRALI